MVCDITLEGINHLAVYSSLLILSHI